MYQSNRSQGVHMVAEYLVFQEEWQCKQGWNLLACTCVHIRLTRHKIKSKQIANVLNMFKPKDQPSVWKRDVCSQEDYDHA